jgi:hypothetical protein
MQMIRQISAAFARLPVSPIQLISIASHFFVQANNSNCVTVTKAQTLFALHVIHLTED